MSDVASAAVTFNTTAPTPLSGTPPTPVTSTLIELSGPTGPLAPNALRVSRMRAGASGTNTSTVCAALAGEPTATPTIEATSPNTNAPARTVIAFPNLSPANEAPTHFAAAVPASLRAIRNREAYPSSPLSAFSERKL